MMQVQCAHCQNVFSYTPQIARDVMEQKKGDADKPEKPALISLSVECPKCQKLTTITI